MPARAPGRAGAERLLTEYAAVTAGRDDRIRIALAAGLSKNRIHVLSGIARTTIDRVVRKLGETR